MDFEAELKNLKQRIEDVEGVVKTLSGEFRAIHADLIDLKHETTRRFDAADGVMARIVSRLDTVNTQIWSLRDDLPMLLRSAMQGPSGSTGE